MPATLAGRAPALCQETPEPRWCSIPPVSCDAGNSDYCSACLWPTTIASSERVAKADSPLISNRAPASLLPSLAYHWGSHNGRWVLAALVWHGGSQSSLPEPVPGLRPEDIEKLYPHRYGGTAFASRWSEVALGAAYRLGDAVGMGASVALRDVKVSETRYLWAGLPSRDNALDPRRDMKLTLRAHARLSPSASIGVLVAPPELPLEFAFAANLRLGARFRGGSTLLAPTNSSEFPLAQSADSATTLTRPNQATLRAGIRYLRESLIFEVGIDLRAMGGSERDSWALTNIQITDQDGAVAELSSTPALASGRSHMAIRGAIDYEALPGFLWLTAGYSWQSSAVAPEHQMPAYVRMGGHRVALGLLAIHQNYSLRSPLSPSRLLGIVPK